MERDCVTPVLDDDGSGAVAGALGCLEALAAGVEAIAEDEEEEALLVLGGAVAGFGLEVVVCAFVEDGVDGCCCLELLLLLFLEDGVFRSLWLLSLLLTETRNFGVDGVAASDDWDVVSNDLLSLLLSVLVVDGVFLPLK